jgi:serine/threonine protein kinase
VTKSGPPPITPGTVINDRFDIRQSLGKGGMGEVFLAYDRSTQQTVALKVVREESRMPGDDEALRQELLHARAVGHPNVCRVHDLAPSGWGPILVMENIPGQTLHTHIRRKKAQGGYTSDEFRKIASEVCAGLAAIHAQGLVHGDLKPGNVMVTEGKAVILDFGFAQERARAALRRPGAPPDGGTPNYMSPERLRSGGASADDDVYALALTLWEMWTCKVPEPGAKPRSKPMRQQIMFDVPSGLSVDEVKQVFRGLNEDPALRPQARHMRFFNPSQLTTSPIQVPRERLDPGPPPGRAQATAFNPGSQGLLVTYATNAPEIVGQVLALDKPTMTFGRRADQDMVVNEATVSGAHARFKWTSGSWNIEDLGSTNGSYAEYSYERKQQLALIHGGETQLGELRVKLVSFAPESRPAQTRAAVPREARRSHGPARARAAAARHRRRGLLRRLGRGADPGRALRAARAQPAGERAADDPRDARPPPRRAARRRAHRDAPALARPRSSPGAPGRSSSPCRWWAPPSTRRATSSSRSSSQVQGTLPPETLDLHAILDQG